MDETAEGVIPSWVEVKEGNSITLRCWGSITPVEWAGVHFDNQTKSIDNNSITLYNLQKEHSGRYFCGGIKTNSDLKKTVFHDYAVILVDSFIVRFYEPSRSYTIHDSEFSRKCSACVDVVWIAV